MLTINTNVNALKLQHNLSRTTFALDNAYVRLSTGAKINSAADGAAQLMLSKGLETQISGLSVCNNNAQMAKNLLGVADGVLNEVTSMAQRLRDISLMAANGVYSLTERVAFQQEADSLVAEIKRQVSEARFNDYKLFKDGGAGASPATFAMRAGATLNITKEEAINMGYTWVTDATQLQTALANGEDVVLGDNIDLTGVSWNSVDYSGFFEGNNYTISNLSGTGGLFDTLDGAKVKNLKLENFNINSSGNVGALASIAQGNINIDSIHIIGGEIKNSTSGSTGGLIGDANNAYGNISNVTSSANITGGANAGGLIGSAYTSNLLSIKDVYITGNVTGSRNAGGLVGKVDSRSLGSHFTIEDCYMSGETTGNAETGGIVGYCSTNDGTISLTNVMVSGDVNGESYTGGIIGSADIYSFDGLLYIEDASNLGNVTGRSCAGGIAGDIYARSEARAFIYDTHSAGNVEGNSSAGGFIGKCLTDEGYINIEKSYSTSQVTSSDPKGFIGHIKLGPDDEGNVRTDICYYNSSTGLGDPSDAVGMPEEWFTDANLNSVGITNTTKEMPEPPTPPAPPTPTPTPSGGTGSITFQIGTGVGEHNTISVDMDFEVGELNINLLDADSARSALVEIDNLIQKITKIQGGMGASSNIIDSVIDNNTQTKINLTASNSRLIDADIAKESAEMVKNQIRQNMTASLLTQATNNLGPIALTLMGIR